MHNVPGNKSLPEEMAKHVQSAFLAYVAENFTRSDGTTMPERVIAKALGISQSQVNGLKQGKGAGVHALLALSRATNQTVDAILGRELPLPVQQRQEQLDRMIELHDRLVQTLRGQGFEFGPASKPGKIFAEIQRLRNLAVGQKHLDEQRLAARKRSA